MSKHCRNWLLRKTLLSFLMLTLRRLSRVFLDPPKVLESLLPCAHKPA